MIILSILLKLWVLFHILINSLISEDPEIRSNWSGKVRESQFVVSLMSQPWIQTCSPSQLRLGSGYKPPVIGGLEPPDVVDPPGVVELSGDVDPPGLGEVVE